MEVMVQEDGVQLIVALEKAIDGDPEGTHHLFGLQGKVEDVVSDAPIDPTAHRGVSLRPGWVGRCC